MSYSDALQKLSSLRRLGVRLGLDPIRRVLDRLGRPETRFRTVHVAGTTGKGSTAAMLASCLGAAGHRVGLYTSPHLCRFTERMRVDRREIEKADLERLVDLVLGTEPGLTFFETTTAVALAWFAEKRVDVAVVEVGLGGRLDATNVVSPEVCVLTRIDLDHTDLLGERLIDVAREKAGILKPGVPVVAAAPASDEVARLLEERCAALGSELLLAGRDFRARAGAGGGVSFEGGGALLEGVALPLLGEHQAENASLCFAALALAGRGSTAGGVGAGAGLGVGEASLRRGLETTEWPGRLERVGARVILDGAHNPCACRALAAALEAIGERGLDLVVAILGPRPAAEMLAPLLPLASRVVFTRARSARAIPEDELAALAPGSETAPDLAAALGRLEGSARTTLITGSLYLVGEARALLLGEEVDPVSVPDPLPLRRGEAL
jgi:dihydrofolate synthase / folylpolyglutamate synthase